MIFHNEPVNKILDKLESDQHLGLSAQVAFSHLGKYGENRLAKKKKKTILQRFFDQFKDVMILILIAAAVVSFSIACIESNPKEFFEPLLILLIVMINAIMGVMQENKAEKALDALKSLSAPHARVIRNGEEAIMDASKLVPGDIIKLEAGDFVPADARLIKSAGLKSEESALTGESVPSEKDASLLFDKDAPLGDRANMVFSGCSITYGTATAVVTATGMNTEMGKIANLLDNEDESQTPLQKKLSQLGKYLGVLALIACAIIFIVGLSNGIPPMEIFMTAVSLAVSAIPEGLPAIVTIILSIGVQRMVKKNAIIRRLPAVETLGSASVICSDKTGTLTQNRMTLVKAYCDRNTIHDTKATFHNDKTAEDIDNNQLYLEDITKGNSAEVKKLLQYATLCCNGSIIFHGDAVQHIGDPTETAIVLAASHNGMDKPELTRQYPRLAEIPFDSDRKLMTTVHKINGKYIAIVKGAFDVMASRCILGDLETARRMNEKMSSNALRVLAVSYKNLSVDAPLSNDSQHTSQDEHEFIKHLNMAPENLEYGLTFLGLLGMIDPPRPEAKAAVAVCRNAGIKPVMITGDHIVTASAIAKELGILEDGDKAITGAELDNMNDGELDAEVENISVYARVSPENKIRIVKAWQRKNQIVSMTGDGVNDAPALKAADIGCAMGITGTDVAKGAADITLTDDNFATIVDAIREGRGIYANIKKVVGFLLGTNIGEVVSVFTAMILWHKSPFLSMQLLWINLVTDSLPAIALGMENVESNIMERKPNSKNESLFSHGYGVQIILWGIMFGALALGGFYIGELTTQELAGGQTLAFMTLALSQVFHSYNMRSKRSLFKIGIFTNHKLNWATLLSLVLVAIVLFTPLSVPFGLITLPVELYLLGLGFAFIPVIVMEISKAISSAIKQ